MAAKKTPRATKKALAPAPTVGRSLNAHGLTIKQENFCAAYIATGNASEAYRRSYNAGKMKPSTINRNAKTLLDDSKIAARVSELRSPVLEKAQLTMESHLARLSDLSVKAEAAEQYSAAIKAEENRGRVAGLYIDKKEIRVGDLESESDDSLARRIATALEQVSEIEGVPVDAVLVGDSTIH